jgi:ketosteroid isomerase-like protein
MGARRRSHARLLDGTGRNAEGWREFVSAWEEYRIEVEEYREIDDERVLVLFHASGRGRISGLEVGQLRMKAAVLYHVRGGKVTRMVHYYDRDRALADLGLTPDTGT